MLAMTLAKLKVLTAAAEAAYPEEACALIVGRKGPGRHFWTGRIEPARNVAPDRRRRFEVDPGLRIGLERDLRHGPDTVIGVWHSHPDGPARPSAVDLASAFEPELVWIITAVAGGQAVQTAAYCLRDDGGGFQDLPLVLLTGPDAE